MFKTRLLSGIVLMIITIALMIFGGLPLFWVITLITVIGLFELYRAVKMEKTVPALIGYAASIGLDLLVAGTKNGLCYYVVDRGADAYDGLLCDRLPKILQ